MEHSGPWGPVWQFWGQAGWDSFAPQPSACGCGVVLDQHFSCGPGRFRGWCCACSKLLVALWSLWMLTASPKRRIACCDVHPDGNARESPPASWVCHTLSPCALYGKVWWVLVGLGLRHGPSACGRGRVHWHPVGILRRQRGGESSMQFVASDTRSPNTLAAASTNIVTR